MTTAITVPDPPTLTDFDVQVATSMTTWLMYSDGPYLIVDALVRHVYGAPLDAVELPGPVYASLPAVDPLTVTTELSLRELRLRLEREDAETRALEYSTAERQRVEDSTLGLVAVPVGYPVVQATLVGEIVPAVPVGGQDETVEVRPARRKRGLRK